MNDPISNEDQQWLDALAGQEITNPQLKEHAQIVRNALQQRRHEIETDAAKDRSVELAKLRIRLQREGLIRAEKERTKTWVEDFANWFSPDSQAKGSSRGISLTLSRTIPVAIVVVLISGAIWLITQDRTPQIDERLIYRGDPNVVTLLVDSPEIRAKELESGLKVVQATVTVQALNPNGWLFIVQDSDSVRNYLATQRIEGVAVNGRITIMVLPSERIKH